MPSAPTAGTTSCEKAHEAVHGENSPMVKRSPFCSEESAGGVEGARRNAAGNIEWKVLEIEESAQDESSDPLPPPNVDAPCLSRARSSDPSSHSARLESSRRTFQEYMISSRSEPIMTESMFAVNTVNTVNTEALEISIEKFRACLSDDDFRNLSDLMSDLKSIQDPADKKEFVQHMQKLTLKNQGEHVVGLFDDLLGQIQDRYPFCQQILTSQKDFWMGRLTGLGLELRKPQDNEDFREYAFQNWEVASEVYQAKKDECKWLQRPEILHYHDTGFLQNESPNSEAIQLLKELENARKK
jgi:hypothetical protein